MKKIYILLLLLIIDMSLFSLGEKDLIPEGTHSVFGATDVVAGLSFPPFANPAQIEFSIAEMKKLSINRIRIAIDWRKREPEKGSFYWAPMDLRMSTARENNLSVLLTIGSLCPDWARLPSGRDGACLIDETALQTFIEEILARYDNIDKIQFGNEWESGTEDGTAYIEKSSIEKFILYTNILYDAVQRLSPETQVVLGGLTRTYPMMEYYVDKGKYPDFSGIKPAKGVTTGYLEQRIKNIKKDYDRNGIKQNVEWVLENADYDIIDIHLYDDPENWPEYLTVIPDNRPILVSEFGGPNSEFERTRPSYQAVRMESYIDAIEQLPVTEAYYFKLVDSDSSYHEDSGLFYRNMKVKPSYSVFAERLTPIP